MDDLVASLQAGDEEAAYLPTWSRTYAGYRERFVAPFCMQLGGDKRITLEQAPCVSAEHARESKASADGSCTASTVWDAGIVLAALVHASATTDSRSCSRRLLDLGAGTGIVGISAAASGKFAEVVLSDLPTVVPLLQRNVASNTGACSGCRIEVLPLAWDDTAALQRVAHSGPFDLIVGGDLLYRLPVVPPLLHALSHLVSESTTVLLAASLQHSPETIRHFAVEARRAGFEVQRLQGSEAMTDEWVSEEVRVLRLTLHAAAIVRQPPEAQPVIASPNAASTTHAPKGAADGGTLPCPPSASPAAHEALPDDTEAERASPGLPAAQASAARRPKAKKRPRNSEAPGVSYAD